MNKQKKTNNKELVLVVFSVSIVLLITFFYISKFQSSSNNKNYLQTPTKPISPTAAITFRGKGGQRYTTDPILNISFEVPNDYTIEEKPGHVTLLKGSSEINIQMYGTNFDTIQDYSVNSDSKNKNRNLLSRKFIQINSWPAVLNIYDDPEGIRKVYIIKVRYSLFSFQTENSELYVDLEKVANSFEYLGEVD